MKNLDSLLKASQEISAPEPPSQPRSGFMNRLLGGAIIKIILWTLAIAFVGIIIFQLLKTNGLFQRKSASRVSHTEEIQDELQLLNNFDELIKQAYLQGDYRLAVRYNFLKVLQQLRDKEYINYEPDKTNSRYVYELPINFRNDFSKLIFQYEYVWYGFFDLTQEQYDNIQGGFSSFYQKV